MRSRDLLLVLALCLPALLFVLPLTLAGDPYPHLSGAGWTALGLLPLAILLFAGPGRPRSLETLLLGGVVAWAGASYFFRELPDDFEARRAIVVWLIMGLGFATGSALKAEGRRLFSEALVALSLAWSVGALIGGDAFAGSLGNTGATSQVALPGAVVGAWFAAARRGPFGWLGGLAALAFVAHAVLAPVLAGIVCFVFGIGTLFLCSEVRSRTGRVRTLGLFLALPLLGLFLSRVIPATENSATETTVQEASLPSDFDGVGVRRSLWITAANAATIAPLTGFGPGQFQALYPPFRDPAEIELSRHGVCLGGLTEVEHAHSEPLQAAFELGLVAALALFAFLGLVVRRALTEIRTEGEGTRGLSAAALGALGAACLNASWSFVAIDAVLVFALFGAVSGPSSTPRLGRVVVRALSVALFVSAPWGLGMLRHGFALRKVVAAAEAHDDQAHRAALSQALELVPDSFPAATGLARRTAAADDPVPWMALLELRPHSVELFERIGLAALRGGDPISAGTAWDQAVEFSPTHPRLLRNRIRLGWEAEDAARADALFERLQGNGCVDDDWIRTSGTRCLLRGRVDAGLAVLERLEPDINIRVAERLHERAGEATAAGATETGEALRTAASTLWARRHAESGDFRDAVRLYRQATLAARSGSGREATPLTIEFAAALWRADDPERARKEASGIVLDERTRRDAPQWVLDAWSELSD